MDNISIRPGDIVYRYKCFVRHWGVCVSEGVILHNSPGKGEHAGSVGEFSGGKKIYVIRMQEQDRQEIINRARYIIDKPSHYQYLWRNCEHTITEIFTGEPSSPTVNFLGVLAMIGGVAYVATRINRS